MNSLFIRCSFACVLLLAGTPILKADDASSQRRVLAADYSTKRIAIVNAQGGLDWEYPIRDIHDAWLLPNGNLLFQTSWTQILEVTSDKKIVWQYDAGKQNGNAGKQVEVHAFQRLESGLTMIAESGPGRIIEVDATGKIHKEIKLQVARPMPHRDTRLVRKLADGHYLVCQEGDGLVREYDNSGKIVWEYNAKAQVYSAQRLPDGNTLVGCGSGNRVVEVDRSGREVWSVQKNDLPGITLAWVTMVERRPNGNTVIVNCHAGPNNPQVIEVTRDKKVVWTFKDFKHFGNSLPVARILDDAAK